MTIWHIFRFSQASADCQTTASEIEPSLNLLSSDFSPQNSRNDFACVKFTVFK